MNFLRRELAPVSGEAWGEIDKIAKETLIANLSGRRFVDLMGPYGIDYSCVNLGRLDIPKGQKEADVQYGVYQVQPLIETRVNFSLKKWELDNIERGAKDVELYSLVKASLKMAAFEENALYCGFEPGCMGGLNKIARENSVEMTLEKDSVIDAVSEALTSMMKEGVDGPANLVVDEHIWKFLARPVAGGTLGSIIQKQINGRIIYSGMVEGGFLVSSRGGDLELTVGQDFSIGYHNHSTDEISLFMAESFTFRVIAPEAVKGFSLK